VNLTYKVEKEKKNSLPGLGLTNTKIKLTLNAVRVGMLF